MTPPSDRVAPARTRRPGSVAAGGRRRGDESAVLELADQSSKRRHTHAKGPARPCIVPAEAGGLPGKQMKTRDLGRAVLRAYLHGREAPASGPTSYLECALKAGRCLDFGSRIRRQAGSLSPAELLEFARLVGLGHSDLMFWALPTMQSAGLLSYRATEGELVSIEEFIGVQASVLDQVVAVWEGLHPQPEERCALQSTVLAAEAPLTLTDHQQILSAMGYNESLQLRVLPALEALYLLRRAHSNVLGDDVVYNEYVWGSRAVPIAEFLASLPSNERQILTQLSAKVQSSPGIPLEKLRAGGQGVLAGARQVGFIDAIQVGSSASASGRKTFAFPPSLESQLLDAAGTDVLHERKLFVAHILFGHYYGFPQTGKIASPTVLVNALITRGRVGPASAIATDYPLVEAHGLVRVESAPGLRGRAYLRLVKDDVVRDSLQTIGHRDAVAADNYSCSLAQSMLCC